MTAGRCIDYGGILQSIGQCVVTEAMVRLCSPFNACMIKRLLTHSSQTRAAIVATDWQRPPNMITPEIFACNVQARRPAAATLSYCLAEPAKSLDGPDDNGRTIDFAQRHTEV